MFFAILTIRFPVSETEQGFGRAPLRWADFAQFSGSRPAVLCVGSYPTPGRARAGRTEAYARPAGDALGNIEASAGIWTARPFGSWCGGAEGLHPRSEARSHWSMASLAFESEISRAGQIMTTKSSCSQMTRHASLQLSDIPEGGEQALRIHKISNMAAGPFLAIYCGRNIARHTIYCVLHFEQALLISILLYEQICFRDKQSL